MRPLGKRQQEWVDLIREAGGVLLIRGRSAHVWLGLGYPRGRNNLRSTLVPMSIWASLTDRGVLVENPDHSDWRATEYVLSEEYRGEVNT